MPRSRQISATVRPMERRRTWVSSSSRDGMAKWRGSFGSAAGRPGGRLMWFGLGAAFQVQRRDLCLFGGFGDRRRLDVSALGGAGEQIPLQHHGAEDAALDMRKNAAEVVGAEAYGQRGEAGVIDLCGEGFIQVLAVAEEGSDDGQGGGDSVGHGLAGAVLTVGSRRLISGGGIGFFAPLRLGGLGVERRCWRRHRVSTRSKTRRKGAKKAWHHEIGREARAFA